ncbi:MAG TPA: hypothetical protein VFR21_03855, partial [Bradyrhizobium sp.]|nr:hypothetical protein [Bradyrhizobium sp.]
MSLHSGGRADALHLMDEALATTRHQHVWEAELHRLKGELLLTRSAGVDATPAQISAQAEVCFRCALE